MYSNDNHFTKEPFEDNGRCKIHPLSEEGIEAYLSKDSYNYNFIKTKKNPELLKEIEEEIKKEKAIKERENKKAENSNNAQNKEEDLKGETNCPNKNNTTGKACNKSKNKKGNNLNKKNNVNNKCNKGMIKKEFKKKDNMKREKSPGAKLANTIEKLGKVSGPIISNVNNDRGKLWEYPQPYHA